MLENVLGGAHWWVTKSVHVTATGDHSPIFVERMATSRWTRVVITSKDTTRATLKLKLRLILRCDSTQKKSWNRWPLYALRVIAFFHYFFADFLLAHKQGRSRTMSLLNAQCGELLFFINWRSSGRELHNARQPRCHSWSLQESFPLSFWLNCCF